MGYAQYTIPDTEAVAPIFVAFLQHSQTYVYGLISSDGQRCVGLRPTLKIPAASEKNLWYPENGLKSYSFKFL